MSGFYENYSDLDGNGRQEESGSGLRKMLEEALGEIKNLRGELGKLQSSQRERSVSDLLEDKGIDPAVAQLVPEGEDAQAWLDKFGHLFKPAGDNLDADESGELPKPEELDPDLLAEQEAWEAAHGVSTSGTVQSVSDPMKQLEAADSPEKLMALIEQAQRATSVD